LFDACGILETFSRRLVVSRYTIQLQLFALVKLKVLPVGNIFVKFGYFFEVN
jgi:hypothetical protein